MPVEFTYKVQFSHRPLDKIINESYYLLYLSSKLQSLQNSLGILHMTENKICDYNFIAYFCESSIYMFLYEVAARIRMDG